MRKMKLMGVLFAFAFAGAACKGDEGDKKPAAKPAPEATKAEPPKEEPKPEATAKADSPVDTEGLQLNAVPGASLVGGDGVAQFSGSGDQQACVDYANKLVPIFSDFQTKLEGYAARFSASPDGISAMREASGYIKGMLPKLIAIEPPEGTPLFGAHAKMTVSLNTLAEGLDALAGSIESGDQGRMASAANTVQTAATDFQGAVQELLRICGE